jgi:hypothetical protein
VSDRVLSSEFIVERNSSGGSTRVSELELVKTNGNRLRRLVWRAQEGSAVESTRTRMEREL